MGLHAAAVVAHDHDELAVAHARDHAHETLLAATVGVHDGVRHGLRHGEREVDRLLHRVAGSEGGELPADLGDGVGPRLEPQLESRVLLCRASVLRPLPNGKTIGACRPYVHPLAGTPRPQMRNVTNRSRALTRRSSHLPYVTRPKHSRGKLPALLGAALVALCGLPATTKAFQAFGDGANYSMVSNGAFESGTGGWSLSGASVASGNESYKVHANADAKSLGITAKGRVVSPTFCVSSQHPSFRFFAKRTRAAGACSTSRC